MINITIVFPYYINAGMLRKQFETFNAYPKEIREHLQMIVVDDASPQGKRAEEITNDLNPNGFNFQLFRILTDLRWNWLQCRNLGAKNAKHEWLLLTDIDHLIAPKVMTRIFAKELNTKNFYTFTRDNYDGTPYHPHPNSYLMTKKMYWQVGGYDESFAGHYGTDGMWRRRCEMVGTHVVLQDCPITRVGREHIPDASTTTLERKENRDPKALDDIRTYKDKHGLGIETLKLPWKRII